MNEAIISDTSCLISLNNLGLLPLLRKIYPTIIVTPDVKKEWGQTLPDWFIEQKNKNLELQLKLEEKLGKGEASSIVLALELQPSVVIIDEIKGRKIAKSYNLNVIGTLGILILAKKYGYLDNLEDTLISLKSGGFRVSNLLLQKIIDAHKSQ